MKYIGIVNVGDVGVARLEIEQSIQSSTAPPAISVKQISHSLNSTALMKSCASAPTIAAGRNDSRTPNTKRRAAGSVKNPIASCHSRTK